MVDSSASSQHLLAVEVVCATPLKQAIVQLHIVPGTTARQAVDMTNFGRVFPELDLASLALGIYGEPVADDRLLQAGDRVEIYRPLINEPREQRQQQAMLARKRSLKNR